MKAITFQGEGQVRVEDVPRPAVIEPTEAVIRVTLSSVCGSDLHIYHMQTPVNEGAILGHEFVGVVDEVGSAVRRIKPGDRVVASFYASCGTCRACRRGWFSQCEERAIFGHGEFFGDLGGGQAEYCRVPMADRNLEPIPAEVADEDAIFVGDILATAFFAAERAEIHPGDQVAVIGVGPVGLLAVMVAQLFGAARVYAVDMVPTRLEMARGLGAIPIDSSQTHAEEAIKRATDDRGVDCSIECVGRIDAIRTAIHCVRGGGTVSSVGVPNATEADFPYMRMWLEALTYRSGWSNVQGHMRPLLELIAAGRLKPSVIISHRMKLEQGVEAYQLFDRREATKIVLQP